MTSSRFDKYELMGAYHWDECDPRSRRFNPPLVARYQVVTSRLSGVGQALELGCGDGCLLAQLAARCQRAVGVEFEPAAVKIATERLRGLRGCSVVRASVYNLPFAAASFDVAVMADVIEHLDEPARALAEAARVLGPGGRLILTTPKWRPDRRWDPRHVREFRPEELVHCLRPHFEEVRLRFFWPLRWSNWYATRFGWKALKWYARCLSNPFLREGDDPEQFGQILALCRRSSR